jgi:hypothetical protein
MRFFVLTSRQVGVEVSHNIKFFQLSPLRCIVGHQSSSLQIGCTSVFTISLYIYLYNVFHNMFRSYMTMIRLFYMYTNPSSSTIPPYTGQCLHFEVRCYCPL